MTEPLLQGPAPQGVSPELDDLEPLYSDQEEIQPETLTRSLKPSPSGTSAPFLSKPSLTDTLSNFPLSPSQARNPNEPGPSAPTEQPQETYDEDESQNPEPYSLPVQPNNTSKRGRPRRRPLVAEINIPLPQAKPRHLPENQRCDPEEAQERDSLLGPRLELMIEP